jgi:hypothetical protein
MTRTRNFVAIAVLAGALLLPGSARAQAQPGSTGSYTDSNGLGCSYIYIHYYCYITDCSNIGADDQVIGGGPLRTYTCVIVMAPSRTGSQDLHKWWDCWDQDSHYWHGDGPA